MSEFHPPLLVYDRIDRNKKIVRRLLLAFTLLMLPVVSAGAVFLLPFVAFFGGIAAYAVYGQGLEAKIESLDRALRANAMPDLRGLPSGVLLIIGGLLAVATAVMAAAVMVGTGFLIARYGARMVLRWAGARPVGPEREPELFRVVENLCIGAGLPMPRIMVVDTDQANAFATGNAPESASLVVTRGLLTLLSKRELEGVVSHELSHIGNHDIRLNTALSALVGTISGPLMLITAPVRWAFRSSQALGLLVLLVAVPLAGSMAAALVASVGALFHGDVAGELPVFLRWWAVHAMLAPVYATVVAPVAALMIRQAVSRERELLADADAALLTRDPEGLALALARIGTSSRKPLAVAEASVHLYVVDPHGDASLLHRIFPSHPPLQQRIQLLTQMAGAGAGAALAQGRIATA
jgi:heat shock protein HtpX